MQTNRRTTSKQIQNKPREYLRIISEMPPLFLGIEFPKTKEQPLGYFFL
jgi:hypothetical protein